MNPLATPCPPIVELLTRTRVAPRQSARALSLWPLCLRPNVGGAAPPLDYVSLGTALASGTFHADEVSASGEVPHVRVVNEGAHAVLVLFGEEIRGAKQDRVANASFLVPERGELVLDVSCVESGRWHRSADEEFRAADGVISHALRRKIAGQVARERGRGARFASDQGVVWQEIDARLHRSRTSSTTNAYADYLASRDRELRELARAFPVLPSQVGFVAAIGGEVSGAELIGRPDVFRADFAALLRSYAVDAIDDAIVRGPDERKTTGGPGFADPEAFLAALAGTGAIRTPSLGRGDDLRLRGGSVAGCALACGELVHLTAFPA